MDKEERIRRLKEGIDYLENEKIVLEERIKTLGLLLTTLKHDLTMEDLRNE